MVQSNNNVMKKRKDTLARWYFYGTASLAGMLLGLKLGGSITWSWWWVTAPFWVNVLACLALVIWAKLWIRVRWKRK